MLLDRNRIVIRRRSYADVLDLALRVVRAYALPLVKAFVVGVLPMLALNAWLLLPLAPPLGSDEFSADSSPALYFWCMLALVFWEAPLATAAMTLYLGQALFLERPEPTKIIRGLLGAAPN